MNPEVCPNCGALVPRKAKACPGCGSDERTGWSESAYASNLGLPDENFSLRRFLEGGVPPRSRQTTRHSLALVAHRPAPDFVVPVFLPALKTKKRSCGVPQEAS